VLGKQYKEEATDAKARLIAHKFANEIIFRLGGGVNGITESKLYYISNRKRFAKKCGRWIMTAPTKTRSRTWERWLPCRRAFRLTPAASLFRLTPKAQASRSLMYSNELGRMVNFPRFGGTNATPAWAAGWDQAGIRSSMRGAMEIYVADASGAGPKRVSSARGPDVSPVWNPKTGAQIAFVSGRSGLPQIYIMDADGTNLQRMTDQGYAVSPSWSPNGQFLAFAWRRNYGPGAPGGWDIYVMDVATSNSSS